MDRDERLTNSSEEFLTNSDIFNCEDCDSYGMKISYKECKYCSNDKTCKYKYKCINGLIEEQEICYHDGSHDYN